MDSLQGQLLIASPHLPDPNFYRSVVLIVEHQEEGALGVILNRVGSRRLEEVWRTACESECRLRDHLRVGGPVEGPLMALFSDSALEGHEVVPGVYFSSERDVLESLVMQDESTCRIFSGYAGWGGGQLDEEMRVGGWLTAPAHRDHVFDKDEETLWQRVVNTIGDEITRNALNIRHVPTDPSCN
jgi:putative transcriptional regulator